MLMFVAEKVIDILVVDGVLVDMLAVVWCWGDVVVAVEVAEVAVVMRDVVKGGGGGAA